MTTNIVALARTKEIPKDTPSPISSFLKGAYSFPVDWWIAIQWSLGIQGVYGSDMQRKCQRIGNHVDSLLALIQSGSNITYKITNVVVRYIIANEASSCVALNTALERIDREKALSGAVDGTSHFAGRYAGGLFTLHSTTGGRFGTKLRAVKPVKLGLSGSNFTLASAGAVIRLAIKTGGAQVSAADVAMAILVGTSDRLMSKDVWIELVKNVETCSTQTDTLDHVNFKKMLQETQQFIASAKGKV